jgi:acetyl-CoA acetyltransferase family protein
MRSGGEVVIIDAVRSPVGRGDRKRGMYRNVHPTDLLGQCFAGLVGRAAVPADEVENVIAGCVYQIGEQAAGVTRLSWLRKGLPESAAATTVDLRCGSGQQATALGAASIAGGIHDLVVTGGVEHMGRIGFVANEQGQREFGRAFTPELLERYQLVGQGLAAELIADRWSISRREMDELALDSHRRASRARRDGRFDREIVPIEVDGTLLTTDEGIRQDTSIEALAKLKPAFREDGAVTAGNSSQVSDGAAALLLASAEKADRLGLRARARIVDHVVLGVDPVTMLTGPIPATQQILHRNQLQLSDIGRIEINEAFASVVLAWARELAPDMERVNTRGGAIALGHPLGSTGARLIATLLHTLEDDDEELGLVTMCCSGGLGTATLIQRL